MASAAETRDEAIRALETSVRKMNSASFLLALRSAPAAERAKAGKAMIDAGIARQTLRRARLEDIAARLEAEEQAIRDATADLEGAVQDLKKVKAVVDGVTSLLKVVGRIVALV